MSTPSATNKTATRIYEIGYPIARNWWAMALRGVLAIIFGLIAIFMPGDAMLALVLVFAAYVFIDGILAITAAVRAVRKHERWGYLLLEGVVDIIAAVIAVLWPGITVLVFVLLVAAWALVSGGFEIAAAFRLSGHDSRWWLVLGGVASIIFGILLAIAPVIGAVVLTWWLGAYALVFGVALLVAAFRMRSVAPAQA